MEAHLALPADRRRKPIPPEGEFDTQSSVYSFRCSKLLDYYMGHLMDDHTVNRTQVIRLGVFMLASFSLWEENKGLTLEQLVQRMEARSPETFPRFSDFCSH